MFGWRHLKLITGPLQKPLLVLASDLVVISPVNDAPVESLETAPFERFSLNLKCDLFDTSTEPGSALSDFAVDVFFFFGLGDLNQAEVCLGRMRQPTLEETVQRTGGKM